MGLTLATPPGFADLDNAVLQANDPAFAINLAKIYSNAAFGMVRTEIFSAIYIHGDTVPLPVSDSDGYNYSRDELLYIWTVKNSGDPNTLWLSGPDSLWYANWNVDQTTGAVTSHEWYRRSGSHFQGAHSNDGKLLVFTIAQRAKSSLLMAAAASYVAITSGVAQDNPLEQLLAQSLNKNAKWGVVNSEVIYLGEFKHGDTVPHPVSPADGHSYAYAECAFMFSWRWTTDNTSFVQPALVKGQLGPMKASVNSSGVCSVSVSYIDDNDILTAYTSQGRIAVFALCNRSGGPGSFGSPQASFAELSYDFFMPGQSLRASIVQAIIADTNESILTPEFFGPTNYADGATVALPVSTIDGYAYSRAECDYIWSWADTTNQSGSNLRVPIFYGVIDKTTGVVTLNVWRLPPGGPYVDDDNTKARISVIVFARRQAALPAVVDTGTITPGSGVTGSSAGSGADVPTLSTVSFVSVPSTTRGDFQIAHGLGAVPVDVNIKMTSAGLIRFQASPSPPWDATYVYLNASADGLTALLGITQ